MSKGVRLRLIGGVAVTGAYAAARHLGTRTPRVADCVVTVAHEAVGMMRHVEAEAALATLLLAERDCDDGLFVRDGMRHRVCHARDALDREAVASATDRVGVSDDARDTLVATPEHVVALALRDGADDVVSALVDADVLDHDALDAILGRHGLDGAYDGWKARADRVPSPAAA